MRLPPLVPVRRQILPSAVVVAIGIALVAGQNAAADRAHRREMARLDRTGPTHEATSGWSGHAVIHIHGKAYPVPAGGVTAAWLRRHGG